MTRHDIIERIGSQYHTANIEEDGYSYVKAVGGKDKLKQKLGHSPSHYKLDIRFENSGGSLSLLRRNKTLFRQMRNN